LTGGGGLSQIPIIDWRSYRDDLADEHVRFQSLVTRSRLIAASGNADNQVILVDPRSDVFAVLSDFPTSIYAQRQGGSRSPNGSLVRRFDGRYERRDLVREDFAHSAFSLSDGLLDR